LYSDKQCLDSLPAGSNKPEVVSSNWLLDSLKAQKCLGTQNYSVIDTIAMPPASSSMMDTEVSKLTDEKEFVKVKLNRKPSMQDLSKKASSTVGNSFSAASLPLATKPAGLKKELFVNDFQDLLIGNSENHVFSGHCFCSRLGQERTVKVKTLLYRLQSFNLFVMTDSGKD
jgi:hypothetical protein